MLAMIFDLAETADFDPELSLRGRLGHVPVNWASMDIGRKSA
jgi:hypothetical protein